MSISFHLQDNLYNSLGLVARSCLTERSRKGLIVAEFILNPRPLPEVGIEFDMVTVPHGKLPFDRLLSSISITYMLRYVKEDICSPTGSRRRGFGTDRAHEG